MSTTVRGRMCVDRAAIFLIKRFGEDCALVAQKRALYCSANGDEAGAAEWRAVINRLISLYFAPRSTMLH